MSISDYQLILSKFSQTQKYFQEGAKVVDQLKTQVLNSIKSGDMNKDTKNNDNETSMIVKEKNREGKNKNKSVNHYINATIFTPFSQLLSHSDLNSTKIMNKSESDIKVYCYDGSDYLNLISHNKYILKPNQSMQCYTRTKQTKVFANDQYFITETNRRYSFDANKELKED